MIILSNIIKCAYSVRLCRRTEILRNYYCRCGILRKQLSSECGRLSLKPHTLLRMVNRSVRISLVVLSLDKYTDNATQKFTYLEKDKS